MSRPWLVVAPLVVGLSVIMASATAAPAPTTPAATTSIPSPTTGLLPSGRLLTPIGALTTVGNLPLGAALTRDGSQLWTVSAGLLTNDVQIVDVATHRVCQVLSLPGASGGIALDSDRGLAYISGLPNSRWQPYKYRWPGAAGDVVFVYSFDPTACGRAVLQRTIPVPPGPNAPTTQAFPPPRAGLATSGLSWPMHPALTSDGTRLVVPLNLADSAAVIDLASGTAGDRVRYVPAGSYPYGAATIPRTALALVSNEADGTVSMIDLVAGTKVVDIAVGAPLSHPSGMAVNRAGTRAFVALSASDQVVVIDVPDRTVERTIWVGRQAGLGTKPVAVALSPDEATLFAAESGADELTVVALKPRRGVAAWSVVGRIPTASVPQAVVTSAFPAPGVLGYVSAEGRGIGPNPAGPNPTAPADPIFWAFNPIAPTTNVFAGVAYGGKMVRGSAATLPLPTDAQVMRWTPAAVAQLRPSNPQAPPPGTPLRADGPIKHVFFIVRENRSYDQVLGDVARGNGDPKLTVFPRAITPNLHALTDRFGLLDSVYANGEASIQGHYWTSSASVPDYVTRNWVPQYAGRGRPNDFGTYAVTYPGNAYLFARAEEQGITYANFGEAFMGGVTVPDRDATPELVAMQKKVSEHSVLGPPFGGCYPGDMSIGTALDGNPVFDARLPAGAPKDAYSHADCYLAAFDQQVAGDEVPALTYLSLTSDHTRGTQPGFRTPTAMVADSDLAIGQIVSAISHSPVWASSAIFIVEDDSQDGADHVNAHRIPVAVVSPFAQSGVVHTRYDLPSVVRSIELILGMSPLSLNDALATPMYDAFSGVPKPDALPANIAPYDALMPAVDMMQMNSAASPDSMWSSRLALDRPDQVSQADLDVILWHSVHGADSPAPPPGPGAEGKDAHEPDVD